MNAGAPSTKPGQRRRAAAGRRWVIGIPYLWLLLFFLLPFLIVLRISVSEMLGVTYSDLLSVVDGAWQLNIRFSNYLFITEDELYILTYLSSLKYAAITTLLCLPSATLLPISWRVPERLGSPGC